MEVMFDYVVDYIAKHPTIAPARDFRLSDAEYEEFKQRVVESGFNYDPVTEKTLGELEKLAKFEGYYDDAKDEFDALRKKLKKDGYTDISVTNCAIGNIPKDAQLVVSHEKLAERALEDSPQAEHIWVKDFTQNNVYAIVSARLKGEGVQTSDAPAETEELKEGILTKENVKVGLKSVSKEEAIKTAGELLVKGGYVDTPYVQGMLNREKDITTYIGKGIAIPHGENAVKDSVKKSGIVVLQYPEGIQFGDDKAHLIIGIAGRGNDHLAILANLATTMDEYSDEQLHELYTTKDPDVLYKVFTKVD